MASKGARLRPRSTDPNTHASHVRLRARPPHRLGVSCNSRLAGDTQDPAAPGERRAHRGADLAELVLSTHE
jgi:hypothetical protein